MVTIGEVKRSSTTVCDFEWSIPEFASLSIGNEYCSPDFEVLGKLCHIYIYVDDFKSSIPSMTQKNILDYIVIGLYMSCPQIPPILLEVSFAIRNADGYKEQERDNPCQILFSDVLLYEDYHYISKAELLERASKLMPSNILTVVCTARYLKSIDAKCETESAKCIHCQELVDAKTISLHEKKCLIKCPECSEIVALKNWHDHECHTTKPEGEPCTSGIDLQYLSLVHDFKELFRKKENCDVVLRVKGEEFPAHKAILEARSSMFASTFRIDTNVRSTGVMEINDCDPSCFSDFLCFLYSGDVNISKKNVFSLSMVAEKYDVQDLRVKCLTYMKDNLSVDTFCDTLTLALLLSKKDLIKLSTHFFTKNAPKIILTVKWQMFLEENPTQSNELLIKLLTPDAS